MPKLESRFYKGIWLGKDTMTSESIHWRSKARIIRSNNKWTPRLNQTSTTDDWWTSSMHHHRQQRHWQKHATTNNADTSSKANKSSTSKQTVTETRRTEDTTQQQDYIQQISSTATTHSRQAHQHQHREAIVDLANGQWRRYKSFKETTVAIAQRDNSQTRSHKAVSPKATKNYQSSNRRLQRPQASRNHQQQEWGSMPWQVTTRRGETINRNVVWRRTTGRD